MNELLRASLHRQRIHNSRLPKRRSQQFIHQNNSKIFSDFSNSLYCSATLLQNRIVLHIILFLYLFLELPLSCNSMSITFTCCCSLKYTNRMTYYMNLSLDPRHDTLNTVCTPSNSTHTKHQVSSVRSHPSESLQVCKNVSCFRSPLDRLVKIF